MDLCAFDSGDNLALGPLRGAFVYCGSRRSHTAVCLVSDCGGQSSHGIASRGRLADATRLWGDEWRGADASTG
jgi:hypothetical protein